MSGRGYGRHGYRDPGQGGRPGGQLCFVAPTLALIVIISCCYSHWPYQVDGSAHHMTLIPNAELTCTWEPWTGVSC